MRFRLLFLMLTAVLSFSLPTFAQEIRIVYFKPQGIGPINPNRVNEQLDILITKVQKLFLDQLGTTFSFEKEEGKAKVHHFFGEENSAAYLRESREDGKKVEKIDVEKIRDEISNSEHYLANEISSFLYLIAADLTQFNPSGVRTHCGMAGYLVEPTRWRFWEDPIDRQWAVIDVSKTCFGDPIWEENVNDKIWELRVWITAHELGHAFGLQHDFFRDNSHTYIMSYGRDPHPNGNFSLPTQLSECSKKWLEASRYFNPPSRRPSDQEAEIFLNSTLYSPVKQNLHLEFTVTDADRLHAAQLFFFNEVVLFDCRSLNGPSDQIEFDTETVTLTGRTQLQVDSDLYDRIKDEVRLQVIDSHGYITRKKFSVHPSLRQPRLVGSIDDLTLTVGEHKTLDVSNYFSANIYMDYSADLNNKHVAIVNKSSTRSVFTITALNAGSAIVTVTASWNGLRAKQSFTVTVTSAEKLIYWTEDDKIYQSQFNGAVRKVVLSRAGKRLGQLALDVSGGKVYWSEFPISGGTTTLKRANLDGSRIETVAVNVGALTDLFLDTSNSKLYWAAIIGRFEENKIRRSNLDGSQVEDLVTNLNPGDIALFGLLESLALDILGGKMYWAEAVYKVRENNTIQIIDMGKIRRSNLDGSQVEDLVTGLSSRAIALDVLGGRIYWINNYASKLQRANLDGSQVEDLVSVPNIETHFNLSLDVSGGKMYWGSTHIVLRANLDGTQAEILYEVTNPLNNIIGDIVFAVLPREATHAAPSTTNMMLATAPPTETSILPNYPNPFNPETWIPYQLSKPADVTLSIYSVDGKLVRTLALGHQPAGVYQSKSRAAYWGGRNSFGERVASGLYFYTFTAGDFTATRKMLIRK